MPRGAKRSRYSYYGDLDGATYRVNGEENTKFFGEENGYDGYRIKVEPFFDNYLLGDGKGKKKKGKNNGPHMSWREWDYYQELERLYKDSMRCTCYSSHQEPQVSLQLGGACGPSSYCPIHGRGRGGAPHPGHCAVSIGNCSGPGPRSAPLSPHDRRTHYNMGYDEGAVDGYDGGYRKGRDKGYAKGDNDGYSRGYNHGWDDGRKYEVKEGNMHFSRNVHFRSPLSRYH